MPPGAAHTRGTHHAFMVWWFGTPMWVHWVGVPRRPQLKMSGVRPNMASNHHPSTPTAAVDPMGVVVSRFGWCAGRYGSPAGLRGCMGPFGPSGVVPRSEKTVPTSVHRRVPSCKSTQFRFPGLRTPCPVCPAPNWMVSSPELLGQHQTPLPASKSLHLEALGP